MEANYARKGPAGNNDVVKGPRGFLAFAATDQGGLQRLAFAELVVAAQDRAHGGLELVAANGGEKPEAAKVYAEDRGTRAFQFASDPQDGAVSAKHDNEIGGFPNVFQGLREIGL